MAVKFNYQQTMQQAQNLEQLASDLRSKTKPAIGGVKDNLNYLEECGINYLHLMPLLDSTKGKSDGGYAVSDFRKIRPSLGTMEDLEELADGLPILSMADVAASSEPLQGFEAVSRMLHEGQRPPLAEGASMNSSPPALWFKSTMVIPRPCELLVCTQ